MKIITVTAILTTIILASVGAVIEVNEVAGSFYSGLYYFVIIAGSFIIPIFLLSWIYAALVSRLSVKKYLYRGAIGIALALIVLFIVNLIDMIPNLLEAGYVIVASGLLLTFIHSLIERVSNKKVKHNFN